MSKFNIKLFLLFILIVNSISVSGDELYSSLRRSTPLIQNPITVNIKGKDIADVVLLANVNLSRGVQTDSHLALQFHGIPNFDLCYFGVKFWADAINKKVEHGYAYSYATFITDASSVLSALIGGKLSVKNITYLLDREFGANILDKTWVASESGPNLFISKQTNFIAERLQAIDVYVENGWDPNSVTFRAKKLNSLGRLDIFVINGLIKNKDEFGDAYIRAFLTPDQTKIINSWTGAVDIREVTIAMPGHLHDALIQNPVKKIIFRSQNFWKPNDGQIIDAETLFTHDKKSGLAIIKLPVIGPMVSDVAENLSLRAISSNIRGCRLVIDSISLITSIPDVADVADVVEGEPLELMSLESNAPSKGLPQYLVSIIILVVFCGMVGWFLHARFGVNHLLNFVYFLAVVTCATLGLQKPLNVGNSNYFFTIGTLLFTILMKRGLRYLSGSTLGKGANNLSSGSAYFCIGMLFLILSVGALFFLSDLIAGQLANVVYFAIGLMTLSGFGNTLMIRVMKKIYKSFCR